MAEEDDADSGGSLVLTLLLLSLLLYECGIMVTIVIDCDAVADSIIDDEKDRKGSHISDLSQNAHVPKLASFEITQNSHCSLV